MWKTALFVALTITAACEPRPPRVPVADPPITTANTCKVAGAWCAYNADCCSGACESESSFCH
jgi:hypothetical protein